MVKSEDLTPKEHLERQLRQEYGELYDQLTRMLYTHDPVGLAALGAPADEYSVEVNAFLPHLKAIESPAALSQFVYGTFVHMFSANMMEHRRAKFDTIAEDIWRAYQQWCDARG